MHIILADDHVLVREGLAYTLRNNMDDPEISEAADGKHLIKILEEANGVDLVLFDLFMPGTNAFETISLIVHRWPETPVIVVSAADNPNTISKAIDLGVSGYITKSISTDEMMLAIEQVLKGGIYVQNVMPQQKPQYYQSQPDDYAVYQLEGLTRRQKDVVWLLAQGKSNQEIADFLGVSIHTIKIHVKNIFDLFGVSNRTEVLVKLKERGRTITQNNK